LGARDILSTDSGAKREGLKEVAKRNGATDARIMSAEKVVVRNWVRLKCQFGCDDYGRRLTCPPYSPTPEEFRKILSEYRWVMIMQFGGSPSGNVNEVVAYMNSVHERSVRVEREAFLQGFYAAFALASGPCPNCSPCNIEGCKNPFVARPSMEGCGVDVYSTVRNAGFEINVVRDTSAKPTFYSMLLVE